MLEIISIKKIDTTVDCKAWYNVTVYWLVTWENTKVGLTGSDTYYMIPESVQELASLYYVKSVGWCLLKNFIRC